MDVIKLKGIAKVDSDSEYDIREGLQKLLSKNGLNPWGGTEAKYKVSLSIKRGKRRKLKKLIVHHYNRYPCECCGPYWVAEIVSK